MRVPRPKGEAAVARSKPDEPAPILLAGSNATVLFPHLGQEHVYHHIAAPAARIDVLVWVGHPYWLHERDLVRQRVPQIQPRNELVSMETVTLV